MKQITRPHFHDITPSAAAEAAALIAHSLPGTKSSQRWLLAHVDAEAASVCLLYKNAHEQIALKPFMTPGNLEGAAAPLHQPGLYLPLTGDDGFVRLGLAPAHLTWFPNWVTSANP